MLGRGGGGPGGQGGDTEKQEFPAILEGAQFLPTIMYSEIGGGGRF